MVFILNAAWQSVVLLLVGLALARVFRKAPAHIEYLTWCVALSGAALTPWLSLVPFSIGGSPLHRWTLRPESIADFSLWFDGKSQVAQGHTVAAQFTPVLTGVAIIYGAFLLAQVARFLWGLLRIRSIVSRAMECCDSRVLRLSERFTDGRSAVRILGAADVQMPFAVGVLRPAIILPVSLVEQAQDNELVVVLAHEFAHIQRRDWVWNLVLLLISLPVSFHPCVALMRRKVEAAREAACDELAAGCVDSASSYARALLDLAGRLAQPQPSLAAAYKGAALGVLDGSTLGDRIRRLMDRSPRLSTKQTRILFAAAICILLIACMAVTNFALASPSDSSKVPQIYQYTGSVAGVWTGKLTDRNPRVEGATVGHSQAYLQLQQNGSQITGVIGADAEHNAPIENAVLDGNRLHFQVTMKHDGPETHWTVDVVVNGNQMSGTGHALRSDQHSWDVEINLARQS